MEFSGPTGHSVTALVETLPAEPAASAGVHEAASRLDKRYIPTRYPNGFASGFPGKLYTRGDAEAIQDFCRRHLSE